MSGRGWQRLEHVTRVASILDNVGTPRRRVSTQAYWRIVTSLIWWLLGRKKSPLTIILVVFAVGLIGTLIGWLGLSLSFAPW